MLYTDAESNQTQSWLKRQKNVAHNITLRHAPVAERMIGHIKSQIIHAIRGTKKKAVGSTRRRCETNYNENHVSRNTLMRPKDAEKNTNTSENAAGEHQKYRQPTTLHC
jgi:hypothetical protein